MIPVKIMHAAAVAVVVNHVGVEAVQPKQLMRVPTVPFRLTDVLGSISLVSDEGACLLRKRA